MPLLGWYVLDENHDPVLEPDVLKAGLFFEDFSKRCVAQHQVGESHVSTVFLGIDHDFSSSGPPLLFETLIEGVHWTVSRNGMPLGVKLQQGIAVT
jgi:hypothetical protein